MSTRTTPLDNESQLVTLNVNFTAGTGQEQTGERRRGRRSEESSPTQRTSEASQGFFTKASQRGLIVTIKEHAAKQISRERALMTAGYWRVILLGLVFQWVHSIAANVAYYLHEPRETLKDFGFAVIPELGPEWQWISEAAFFTFFVGTILFALSPLVVQYQRPKFATAMIARFLGVCVLAQTLRIICFLSTSLPGPNYHCRPYSAEHNPPRDLYSIVFNADPFKHCGDLVFSSHTIFIMLSACTWNRYGSEFIGKKPLAVICAVFGCLVIGARKHYTLDVVVAIWTVPLLWIAYERYYSDKIPEFTDLIVSKDKGEAGSPSSFAGSDLHLGPAAAHGGIMNLNANSGISNGSSSSSSNATNGMAMLHNSGSHGQPSSSMSGDRSSGSGLSYSYSYTHHLGRDDQREHEHQLPEAVARERDGTLLL